MAVTWTKEQQDVIELRNQNLLVSAAAGSGKTAVLVERIITRLIKDTPPIDVDQLLVVTYTEAAAAEMKERISAALETALEEQPDNAHLKKQTALIHTAKIMTIHSFCLSVIREYFHTIDLDPGFRIVEEGELKLLKQDVLEQLLEEKYEAGQEEFLQFVESFATERDDKTLEKMILQLYEYAGSHPNSEKWLDECANVYNQGLDETSDFMKKLIAYLKKALSDVENNLELAKRICLSEHGPNAYLVTIEEDKELLKGILQADTYEALHRAFTNLGKWPRLAVNKDKSINVDQAEWVKTLRAGWKDTIDGMKKNYFFQEMEEMETDMQMCYPVMKMLVSLVKEFGACLAKKKEEKNVIDFHDMEQFALKILTREEGDVFVPSEVARAYQSQFEEIMIDEYQDSNLLQETILSSVSRMSQGKNNMFMVGDVKQSIYRFRMSRPELFMEKFQRYQHLDGCRRIDLHKNFRSRKEVLNVSNAIFEKIMTEKLGGIAYDEDAALYVGAEYPEQAGNRAEILMVETKTGDAEYLQTLKADEARTMEIRAVAEKIHELMENKKVWDKKKGEFRDLRYKDIVILSRSLKGYAEIIPKILGEEEIPVYAQSQEGYYETLEIGWILDYLKVLDNYRQDLSLAAVLKSPFGKCTNEELAKVRSAWPGVSFHEAVLRTVGIWWQEKTEPVEKIGEDCRTKLEKIFEQLEGFRNQISYLSIHELLWKIMEETGYRDYISAMPGGEQRAANLDMLLLKAKAFEKTSYKGLFHFVRYMEQLKKYEMDTGEAGIFDEQMDAVRLMSIHKSKGLEFPVVIVIGMGRRFSAQDSKGDLVMHPELGLGIDAIDLSLRTRSTTLIKSVIQCENRLENLAEELRVLYVALTRAEEKLILVGTSADSMKKVAKLRDTCVDEELAFSELCSANCYFDWVLKAAVKISGDLVKIQYRNVEDIVENQMMREQEDILNKKVYLYEMAKEEKSSPFYEFLEAQFSYCYPEETKQVKLKYSVSELKKHAATFETMGETGEDLVKEENPEELLPNFMKEEQELTGSAKGTAYHKVMELLDFCKEYDKAALEEQLECWEKDGYLTSEMKACINIEDILTFLKSDVGIRMRNAAQRGVLYKEQPFVLGVSAKDIYPEKNEDETVLVQGIIDVFFEEDGSYVILDYKTDRVYKVEELLRRYKEQLKLYARAVEQIMEKPVKERIIYSFVLEKETRC